MNEKLPYEQLIADKFQDLHLPGKEASWQKMKEILDKEMPEPGKDKKRGFAKWRNLGFLILLLAGATTITLYLPPSNKQTSSTVVHFETLNLPDEDIISVNEATTKKRNNGNLNLELQRDKDAKPLAEKNSTTLPVIPEPNNITANNKLKQIAEKKNEQLKHFSLAKNQATYKQKNISDGKDLMQNNIVAIDDQSKPLETDLDKSDAIANESNKIIQENDSDKQQYNNHAQKKGIEKVIADAQSEELIPDNDGNKEIASPEIIGSLATIENNTLPDLQQAITLNVPNNVWLLPNVAAKKKAILKEIKRQERKNEKELAKSYKTHWSFWGNQTDRWFAAGIAPYQNFSIAAQQTYNYNSGAGRSMIADYIPSPYLQLHVTDRIYLLSEFQFNSPQATPSLLLAQNKASIPMSNTNYTENVYLKKLYYFNMPVSFYYSPVKNFYLGSGLQFSSFNSGLAYREQVSSNNTILQSQTFKIKDDSLSTKINASEWRYLFDANYYVDRFMFGFRYNQALNNFVNIKVNNTLPASQARNQAFQFYVRYNLVVSKRH